MGVYKDIYARTGSPSMAADDPKETQDDNQNETLNNKWINTALIAAAIIIGIAVVLWFVVW